MAPVVPVPHRVDEDRVLPFAAGLVEDDGRHRPDLPLVPATANVQHAQLGRHVRITTGRQLELSHNEIVLAAPQEARVLMAQPATAQAIEPLFLRENVAGGELGQRRRPRPRGTAAGTVHEGVAREAAGVPWHVHEHGVAVGRDDSELRRAELGPPPRPALAEEGALPLRRRHEAQGDTEITVACAALGGGAFRHGLAVRDDGVIPEADEAVQHRPAWGRGLAAAAAGDAKGSSLASTPPREPATRQLMDRKPPGVERWRLRRPMVVGALDDQQPRPASRLSIFAQRHKAKVTNMEVHEWRLHY